MTTINILVNHPIQILLAGLNMTKIIQRVHKRGEVVVKDSNRLK